MKPDRSGLLIAGGASDPCLRLLVSRAQSLGVACHLLLHEGGREMEIALAPLAGTLVLDGRQIAPAAAFLRLDVFSGGAVPEGPILPKPPAWFAFALGAVLSMPGIRVFNRLMSSFQGVKIADLCLAARIGLPVPETLVSNSLAEAERFLERNSGAIAKPVNGGGYSKPLSECLDPALAVDGCLPLPAFLQEGLSYPEYRVYRVGRTWHVFRIESEMTDYRADPAARMRAVPISEPPVGALKPALAAMADALGLDFCAFDLKTRPSTGELCFLEVNSGPMFAAHDHASGGRLTESIICELVGRTD